jgi:hypothetical protein
MKLNEQVYRIKELLFELSPQSAGVTEFLELIDSLPELLKHLKFNNRKELLDYVEDSSYGEFDELRNEVEYFLKRRKKYFSEELPEFERVANYLRDTEKINVSVEDIFNSFLAAKETDLNRMVWNSLENTESNEIKKGDLKKVVELAKKYKKQDPKQLKSALSSGDYRRPLILQFGNRYHLVAGNTRLSTAAALGITPKVIIGKLNLV